MNAKNKKDLKQPQIKSKLKDFDQKKFVVIS